MCVKVSSGIDDQGMLGLGFHKEFVALICLDLVSQI